MIGAASHSAAPEAASQSARVRDAINRGRMSPLQIRTVMLCALLNVMDGYDIMAMVFTASAISTAWSLSATQLGFLLSAGMVGMGFGAVLITPLADRLGRKAIVQFSLVVIAAGMAFSALTENFQQMVIARLITGLGVGALAPSLSVIVAEFSSNKWRGGAVSFMGVGYTFGAVLGGLAAAQLLNAFGWHSVFAVGAIATFLLVLLVWLWLPESVDYLMQKQPRDALAKLNRILQAIGSPVLQHIEPPSQEQAGQQSGLRGLLAPAMWRTSVQLWCVSFLLLMCAYFVITWTPRLLVLAGLTQSQSIIGGVLLNSGGVLGCLLFGWLATRLSAQSIALAYFALGTLCLLGLSQFYNQITLAYALTLITGVCVFGAIAGINTLAPAIYPAANRSSGVGMATGIGRLGGILSPALTGVIVDAGQSISALYIYYCVPLVIAAALMWILRSARSQYGNV